jgi:hypothetical protein
VKCRRRDYEVASYAPATAPHCNVYGLTSLDAEEVLCRRDHARKMCSRLIATATAERDNLPWDFSTGIVIAKNPLDVLAHQWLSAEDSADAIARWTAFKNEPVSSDGLKGTS